MENSSPAAADVINEKRYPITMLWVWKSPLIFLLINAIFLLFGSINIFFVLAMVILIIINPLIRMNFHYSLEDKFLLVKQGVISKKERHLPYGVIQNIFLKQDLFDRLFKIATLRIENAKNSGDRKSGSFRMTSKNDDSLGVSGNKINLPGLKKQDAEELKNIILQKIKDNPIVDSNSGL
jgi:uncharacterized membrane protein YdbT with pleckstrin-like domain